MSFCTGLSQRRSETLPVAGQAPGASSALARALLPARKRGDAAPEPESSERRQAGCTPAHTKLPNGATQERVKGAHNSAGSHTLGACTGAHGRSCPGRTREPTPRPRLWKFVGGAPIFYSTRFNLCLQGACFQKTENDQSQEKWKLKTIELPTDHTIPNCFKWTMSQQHEKHE